MPKLWNGVYNAQCSALSPPDLMEAQPKLLPKTRSNSSSNSRNRNSKVGRVVPDLFQTFPYHSFSLCFYLRLVQYWIFSMIIERSAGPKRVEIAGDDAETPLEAILPAEQQLAEQVCLLRDSPFRILRVSVCAANSLMYSSGPRKWPYGGRWGGLVWSEP